MPTRNEAGMIAGVLAAVRSAVESRACATNSRGDHLGGMAAPRVLRFLTMLAVLLMPFGMLRSASAQAMAHQVSMTMSAGHCAGMPSVPAREKKAPSAPCCDCMVACVAIPSKEASVDPMAPAPMAAQAAGLTPAIHGLHPEAATPPPRIA